MNPQLCLRPLLLLRLRLRLRLKMRTEPFLFFLKKENMRTEHAHQMLCFKAFGRPYESACSVRNEGLIFEQSLNEIGEQTLKENSLVAPASRPATSDQQTVTSDQ